MKSKIVRVSAIIFVFGLIWGGALGYAQGSPVLVADSSKGGVVTLNWSTVSDVVRYELYRWNQSDGWVSLGDEITSVSYVDSDVEYGETYWYAVRGCFENDSCTEWNPDYTGDDQDAKDRARAEVRNVVVPTDTATTVPSSTPTSTSTMVSVITETPTPTYTSVPVFIVVSTATPTAMPTVRHVDPDVVYSPSESSDPKPTATPTTPQNIIIVLTPTPTVRYVAPVPTDVVYSPSTLDTPAPTPTLRPFPLRVVPKGTATPKPTPRHPPPTDVSCVGGQVSYTVPQGVDGVHVFFSVLSTDKKKSKLCSSFSDCKAMFTPPGQVYVTVKAWGSREGDRYFYSDPVTAECQ